MGFIIIILIIILIIIEMQLIQNTNIKIQNSKMDITNIIIYIIY